jgi:thymidylate synthase
MTAWNAFRQFLQLGSIQSDTIDHNLNAEIDQSAPLSEKMTSMIDDFIDHCSNAGSSRSSLRQYRTVLTRLLRSLEDGKDDPNVSDTLAREVINGLSADPADRRISMKIWRMWKEYLKISGKVPQYW